MDNYCAIPLKLRQNVYYEDYNTSNVYTLQSYRV